MTGMDWLAVLGISFIAVLIAVIMAIGLFAFAKSDKN
ncbi:Tfp pilus assembly protein PilV [Geomicrobium halophilum]|uniref:Tfp pilus assembly protein PilV n=1 Tax=Geomicrobium halophilum TaxID=549000 RepID=A0A841PKC5_9BACL|nr:Tfp pilus assembly protein PilV [Geomicrobium halophilum]